MSVMKRLLKAVRKTNMKFSSYKEEKIFISNKPFGGD
jgi:hypothetical protein